MQENNAWTNVVGEGEKWLVFLHGWGLDSSSFNYYVTELKSKFKILLIDFSPFGKSKELDAPWTMQNYENCLLNAVKENNVINPIVIAHSFGGRVAICLASKYNIFERLIILSGAGLKPRRNCFVIIKKYLAKLCRFMSIRTPKWLQSADYRVLSPVMKKTFSAIVGTHLDELCKTITCPTLIIWGKKDKSTPLEMGRRMHGYIVNSGLYVIPKAGHFAFVTHSHIVLAAINEFCK